MNPHFKSKLLSWYQEKERAGKSTFWLALIAFLESFIFPIPIDPFIFVVISLNIKRWAYYAFIASMFSVIGGVFAYVLGYFFFDTLGVKIVELYHLEAQLETLKVSFNENTFVTIFTAAFTPIPFKIFTIAAGLLHINFALFVLGAIFGRFLRFFILGALIRFFGASFGERIFKHFNTLLVIFTLAVAVYIVIKVM